MKPAVPVIKTRLKCTALPGRSEGPIARSGLSERLYEKSSAPQVVLVARGRRIGTASGRVAGGHDPA